MNERPSSKETFKEEILAEVKRLKLHPYGGWLLAGGALLGLAICAMPMAFVRDADAHGSRAPIRGGPTLPATCNSRELFIHDTPGPVLMVSDPSRIVVILAATAIVFATINIAGGFVVTQRMLQMFRKS